jgi:hypothetical protein
MEHQQNFPHGLLYSVSPGCISSLHLNNESEWDEFCWNHETRTTGYSFTQSMLALLKSNAIKWGLVKA